jgi:DNA-binding response OmpR family regulator
MRAVTKVPMNFSGMVSTGGRTDMRVLVVEDDRSLGVFLQKGLMLEGHDVEWAGDGDAALDMAAQQAPDLMVLDLGLPRRDGTEVLEALRRDFEGTAVLVLTGRSQVQERVRCLDLGADDFVLKPFSFHELMARCRALLRRRERFADPVLRFGGVEMNRMERTVSYEGAPIDFTAKEFTLMEFLMLRRGVCCSRTELLTQVWHSTPEAGTNIIDVYITYLRRKLAASHPEDDLRDSVIETVRGSGYRLRDKRKVPRFEKPIVQNQVEQDPSQSMVELARGA